MQSNVQKNAVQFSDAVLTLAVSGWSQVLSPRPFPRRMRPQPGEAEHLRALAQLPHLPLTCTCTLASWRKCPSSRKGQVFPHRLQGLLLRWPNPLLSVSQPLSTDLSHQHTNIPPAPPKSPSLYHVLPASVPFLWPPFWVKLCPKVICTTSSSPPIPLPTPSNLLLPNPLLH